MNEAYKNLVERRSVRKYNNKKVSHDLVEKIIYAGQCAPSGMNRQIFAFVAVEDEELVKELSKKNAEVMNSSADPFYGAKSLIIVFADTHAPTYGKELKNKWGIPESYEGIGHCILGYRDEELGKRAERTSKVVYA